METRKSKIHYKRIIFSIIGFVIIAGLVFGSSVYAAQTLNPTELVHFFVPYPAGRVVRPMTMDNPSGGKICTRPITIDVTKRGIFKQLINPGVEGLSTHWLNNIDSKPHRIGLKFTNESVPIKWEVGAALPWDPVTKTFGAAVGPGEAIKDLGIDWLFYFPEEVMKKQVWYEGNLVVFDADTGQDLTIIPIKFQKGASNESPGRPR